MSAVTEALARAVDLDARVAAGTLPDETHEALAHAVDLSIYGFAHDLRSELHDITEAVFEDNPREWSAGRGGNDPDAFVSGWLEEQIHEQQTEFATEWLAKVDAVMAVPAQREAA